MGRCSFNNNGFLAGAANFYWDAANNRVGIGTSSPQMQIHANVGGMFDHIILGEIEHTSGYGLPL